jgi:hypothetical protein
VLGWCRLGGSHSEGVCQFLDGIHLGITNGCEGRSRGRVAEGPAEVDGCTNGSIGRGELRHSAVVREKLHRAGDAFCSGFGGIDSVAPVVFQCSF